MSSGNTTTEWLYFNAWNRDASAQNYQEIWRADLMAGANQTPEKFAAGMPLYEPFGYGTIFPSVRDMVVAKDANLYVLWMDATNSGGQPAAPRKGDTARLVRYNGAGDRMWTLDAASYIRTYPEFGVAEVHILEHGALASSSITGNIVLALAGYTIDGGGTYERRLWILQVNPPDGTVLGYTRFTTRDPAVAIDATHDVGLCCVYGATWASDGSFWVVADYKFRDTGTVPYVPGEFSGHLYRVEDGDYDDTSEYAPQMRSPQGGQYAWTVPVRISFHPSGLLVMPVFFRPDENESYSDFRIGVMVCGLNGTVVRERSANYYKDGLFWAGFPHPGGICGLERSGNRLCAFSTNRQDETVIPEQLHHDLVWLTDGKSLWRYELHDGHLHERYLDAGGTVGQGTVGAFNCHGLIRRANGDLLYLTYEHVTEPKDMLVRLTVADAGTGQPKLQITKTFVHTGALSYLDQPYAWTEGGRDVFPWVSLAVQSPRTI